MSISKDVNRIKLFLYLYNVFNLISIKNTNQQWKQFRAVGNTPHSTFLLRNVTLKYLLQQVQ